MKKSRRDGLPPKPSGSNTRRLQDPSLPKKRSHKDMLNQSKLVTTDGNPLDNMEVGWDEDECHQTRKRTITNSVHGPNFTSFQNSSNLGSNPSSDRDVRRFSSSFEKNNSLFLQGVSRGSLTEDTLSQSYDNESAEDRARSDEILDMKIFALTELQKFESDLCVPVPISFSQNENHVDVSASSSNSAADVISFPLPVSETVHSTSSNDNIYAESIQLSKRSDSVSSEHFQPSTPIRFHESQISEDPSQPDFIDSIIEFPVHGLSFGAQSLITGSSSSESTAGKVVSTVMKDLSLSTGLSSRSSLGVSEENYSFDDCLSDDALKALEALEAKAFSHLSQKKGTESIEASDLRSAVNKSVGIAELDISIGISTVSTKCYDKGMKNAADDNAAFVDNFDLDMLDALEKQAMSDVSKRRQSQSSLQVSLPEQVSVRNNEKSLLLNTQRLNKSADNTVPLSSLRQEWLRPTQYAESITDTLYVRRFVALNVTSIYNESTRQREKIIACYCPDNLQHIDENGTAKLSFLSKLDVISHITLSGDSWYDTEISGGDNFQIIFIEEAPSITLARIFSGLDLNQVNDRQGIIITNPDVLITPSRVSESLGCIRKGILSDRIRSYGSGSSLPATLGQIKHCFIEGLIGLCLRRLQDYSKTRIGTHMNPNNNPWSINAVPAITLFDESDISRMSNYAIRENLEALSTCDVDENHVRSELTALVPMVSKWIDITTTTGILVKQEMISVQSSDLCNVGCIFFVLDSMHDMEETVWSPVGGIKGQIDMVVKGHIEFRIYPNSMLSHINALIESPLNANPILRTSILYSETLYRTVVPLELKTGKWKPQSLLAHRAQTKLYLLMLWLREQNCNQPDYELPNFGLLCYMSPESCRCEVVTTSWVDIKGLIITRNRISVHLQRSNDARLHPLPNVLRSEVNCESCFQAAECMSYHAAIESGDVQSCGTADLFLYSLRGFTRPEHMQYFKHWDRLLDLEAATSTSNQHLIWTISGALREISSGCCLANLSISNFYKLQVAETETISSSTKHCIDIENFEPLAEYTLELKRNIEHDPKHNIGASEIMSNKRWNLDVGDPVIVSLERDIGKDNSKNGSKGIYTEPNVCSGVISFLENSSDTGIVCRLTIKKIPFRLLGLFRVPIKGSLANTRVPIANEQFFQRFGWSIRIDKDELSFGVATLRTNLLRLFTNPHAPMTFRELKKSVNEKSKHNTISTNNFAECSSFMHLSTSYQSDAGNIRMKDLLISLRRPEFDSVKHLTGSIRMFSPKDESILRYVSGNSQHKNTKFKVYQGCEPQKLMEEFTSLNDGQKSAVKAVLSARDYVLLLGMPGTGKTSTVALIIRILVARGHRILVSSYTHSAVDHLLLKLIEAGVSTSDLIRLGSASGSIHPLILPTVLDQSTCSSREILKSKFEGGRIIACTVLSAARNALLTENMFDWCIMDEAGQISQPAAIGALYYCNKFLLVGDDYQLPPLIVSLEAKSLGMDISLFKRLAEASPHAIVSLKAQYRMNADIMAVCNSLIYEHRLYCATKAVSSAKLCLPNYFSRLSTNRPMSGANSNLLMNVINPDNSVVFIDTDLLYDNCIDISRTSAIRDEYTINHGEVTNNNEVEIVKYIVMELLECGIKTEDVGIICPYRAQVELIQSKLLSYFTSASDKKILRFDVNTVDKFQGRDVDVMIISLVKNKNDVNMGDLLRDWRRVNVAVSRARKKLIILGSLSSLKYIPVLNELRELVLSRNWLVSIPKDFIALP